MDTNDKNNNNSSGNSSSTTKIKRIPPRRKASFCRDIINDVIFPYLNNQKLRHNLLKDWWNGEDSHKYAERNGCTRCIAFNEFRNLMNGTTLQKLSNEADLRFLQVYIHDIVDGNRMMKRDVPLSKQIKARHYLNKMNTSQLSVKKQKAKEGTTTTRTPPPLIDEDETVAVEAAVAATGIVGLPETKELANLTNDRVVDEDENNDVAAASRSSPAQQHPPSRRQKASSIDHQKYLNRKERKANKFLGLGMKYCISTTLDFLRHVNAGPTDYLRLLSLGDGNGGDNIKRTCFTCSHDEIKVPKRGRDYQQLIDPDRHWCLNWNGGTFKSWFDETSNFLLQHKPIQIVELDYFYIAAESWYHQYYSTNLIRNMVPFSFLVFETKRFIVPNFCNGDGAIEKFTKSYEEASRIEDNNIVIKVYDGGDDVVKRTMLKQSMFIKNNLKGRLEKHGVTKDSKYEFSLRPIKKEQNPLYVASGEQWTSFQLVNRRINPRDNSNMITVKEFDQNYHFVEITCREINKRKEWNKIATAWDQKNKKSSSSSSSGSSRRKRKSTKAAITTSTNKTTSPKKSSPKKRSRKEK